MDDEKQKSADAADEAVVDSSEEAKNADVAPETEETKLADDGKSAEQAVVPDAIKQAQVALLDMKDRFLRLQADYANYKKRTAGEKLQLSEIVKIDVLKEILPVLDNFERALLVPQDKMNDDMKSFLEGYEMIYKQLVSVLEKEGLKKMEAVGKPFDPQYHEAVMRTPSEEYDDNVIIEVLQAGYLLGDKTVRPAMVKVAFNG